MAQQSEWGQLKDAYGRLKQLPGILSPSKVAAASKPDPGGNEAVQKYMAAEQKDMAAARAKRAADEKAMSQKRISAYNQSRPVVKAAAKKPAARKLVSKQS